MSVGSALQQPFMFNRLSRKSQVEQAIVLAKMLCLLLGIAMVALMLFNVISQFIAVERQLGKFREDSEKLAATRATVDPNKNTPRDYKILSSKPIFGELNQAPAVAAPVSKPITTLPLVLIGTFLTDGQAPYAIIEDQKNQLQDVFSVNESIFDAAKLVAIYSNKVEINRQGAIEILTIDETSQASSATGAGVGSNAGQEYVVDEAELDQALLDLPGLLTQARAIPYFKDGKSIGLRLFAIKNGSLFEKVGLQNGDILKSINGNSLGDITQAVRLFETLKQERSIRVTLERARTEMELRYQIK